MENLNLLPGKIMWCTAGKYCRKRVVIIRAIANPVSYLCAVEDNIDAHFLLMPDELMPCE